MLRIILSFSWFTHYVGNWNIFSNLASWLLLKVEGIVIKESLTYLKSKYVYFMQTCGTRVYSIIFIKLLN